ncbi:MAG: CDP-alcohol phosphatidyltransferase family protein [Nanoarchaeota archaeon]
MNTSKSAGDLSGLKKEGDEYTMRYLVRPLSRLPSRLLIQYTSITPNQVSVFSFFLAAVSAAFFIRGGFMNQVLGVIFASLYVIFDCVDGNIARVKQLKSVKGHWLDGAGGFIITPLLLFSLLYGEGNPSLFVIGSLAMLAYPLQYLLVYFYKFEITKHNPTPIASGTMVDKVRYLYGSALFFPLLAIAVLSDQIEIFLWFYALFGNLFWVGTLAMQYISLRQHNQNNQP